MFAVPGAAQEKPQPLPNVPVTAEAEPIRSAKLREFDRRRSNGQWHSEMPFDINSIQTQHISAIEFYAGPATMPPELNATQGTCGALVIWTK